MTFKPDKRLKWLPHLGTVDLELELADRVVVATVPALEAAFIELFSESGECLLDSFGMCSECVESRFTCFYAIFVSFSSLHCVVGC